MKGVSLQQLRVRTATWPSATYGLFDYETTKLQKKKMKLSNGGVLLRSGTEIYFEEEGAPPTSKKKMPENPKYLARISKEGDCFYVRPAWEKYPVTACEKAGIIVRTLEAKPKEPEGFKLSLGEQIQVGRQGFRVLEVSGPAKMNAGLMPHAFQREQMSQDDRCSDVSSIVSKVDITPCRICLGDDIRDFNNPIIAPCKCSGSMKYIHLECLKGWIKERVTIKETNHITSVLWESLNCEICKAPYPIAVYFYGKIYELIEVKAPKQPYLIMESYDKDNQEVNGLHIMSFALKKYIKIGRNPDCDLRINEISVSRHHATITWSRKGAYLEDNGSKYGTLAMMRGSHELVPGNPLIIQCGSTIIEFMLPPSLTLGAKKESKSPMRIVKGVAEEEEEVKIQPTDCLPGGGKHAVLFIKRKAYKKLLRQEDLNKRGMAFRAGERSRSLLRKEKEKEKAARGVSPFRLSAMAPASASKPAIQRKTKLDVHLDNTMGVNANNGDTADDVDAGD